jgi:hypothetical protein
MYVVHDKMMHRLFPWCEFEVRHKVQVQSGHIYFGCWSAGSVRFRDMPHVGFIAATTSWIPGTLAWMLSCLY